MAEKVSIIVLAGGKSTRMGQDKVWMLLDGMPMIERVVRRLLPLADEVLISAGESERYESLLQQLSVPGRVVPDQYPGYGPLAGMQAGLSSARNDLALIVAADLPFVNLALCQHMVRLSKGCDGVVPHIPDPRNRVGGLEALHAVYRRTCLTAIEKRLAAGDRQIIRFFDDVRIRELPLDDIETIDPHLLSFFNVNTLEDWHAAQQLLAKE